MDRNWLWALDNAPTGSVALRKESVDRNARRPLAVGCYLVALRKESVDRNLELHFPLHHHAGSLSARRAWIEISV